jgi:hypothetical protein
MVVAICPQDYGCFEDPMPEGFTHVCCQGRHEMKSWKIQGRQASFKFVIDAFRV